MHMILFSLDKRFEKNSFYFNFRYPWHASCKLDWQVSMSCAEFKQKVINQISDWEVGRDWLLIALWPCWYKLGIWIFIGKINLVSPTYYWQAKLNCIINPFKVDKQQFCITGLFTFCCSNISEVFCCRVRGTVATPVSCVQCCPVVRDACTNSYPALMTRSQPHTPLLLLGDTTFLLNPSFWQGSGSNRNNLAKICWFLFNLLDFT